MSCEIFPTRGCRQNLRNSLVELGNFSKHLDWHAGIGHTKNKIHENIIFLQCHIVTIRPPILIFSSQCQIMQVLSPYFSQCHIMHTLPPWQCQIMRPQFLCFGEKHLGLGLSVCRSVGRSVGLSVGLQNGSSSRTACLHAHWELWIKICNGNVCSVVVVRFFLQIIILPPSLDWLGLG